MYHFWLIALALAAAIPPAAAQTSVPAPVERDFVVRNLTFQNDESLPELTLPISDETRGHGTHSLPAMWGRELSTFLEGVRR